MRPIAGLSACVAVALLATAPSPRAAECADAPLKIAVVAPTGEPDVAYGVSLAVAESNDAKSAGAKRPTVESESFNAGDSQMASLAVEKAAKEKFAGVVAWTTESVAISVETVARHAKLPLVLLGPGTATRTLDPNDPVFHVDPSPADRGLMLAEWLRFRSGRSSIGLPSETKHAWLVVEDVPWAHAVAAALRADDVSGIVAAGETKIGSGIPPADLAKARAAACDRFVVIGGWHTLGLACMDLDNASWDVPVLSLDCAIAGGAAAGARKVVYVAASPAWAEERHVDDIVAKHPPAGGKPGPITPAAMRGYVAAAALIDAAVNAGKHGVVGALRDLHEGSGAKEWPLFDLTGCVDHWRWSTWTGGTDSTLAAMKATYLPDAALGPFLGGKPGARYHAQAGATCVRVGFGGGDGQPPKTIDADLATIGLVKEAGPVYDMARDQILARTCGKLSHVWLRNYDGTPRAALSFKIAFVPEGTDTTGASALWNAVIAGDGPDGAHGGQNFPKSMTAQALSTYLLRHAKPLLDAALSPPLSATDATYLNGSYAWNSSPDGNVRADKIRAVLDGAASTFCMKLCKELGNLAGLGVDHSGEARSVMVAKGGEGVSDEFAYYSPTYATVLEKKFGRVGAEGK